LPEVNPVTTIGEAVPATVIGLVAPESEEVAVTV